MRISTDHSRRAFTIIELLAVMAIISVLALLAMPRFGDSKRRAFLAAMQSDLHNLATMAEARFAVEHTYDGLVVPQGSAGVTLTFVGAADSWTAAATHSGAPGVTCTLSSGSGAQSTPTCQ
ncbi:MAG: type IV pilin protein [Gemmatimonas sp.]|jgi:prepilin-type N-terminal cleavage/methylation domain-containing protein